MSVGCRRSDDLVDAGAPIGPAGLVDLCQLVLRGAVAPAGALLERLVDRVVVGERAASSLVQ